MNTAQQVKDMAFSLSNANSSLCACVGQNELLPVQAAIEKRINMAQGMKCRSKQANAALFESIGMATRALARSQVGSEFKRQREHVKSINGDT